LWWHSWILDFLDHGSAVNTDCYCTTPLHLKVAIWGKCLDWLEEKVILPQDNMDPHTKLVTV
jgi:hypothetical protein